MTTEGTFAEVVPHARLVFSEGRVTFTDLGGGRTEMTFRASSPSAEAPAGVASAFDRLADHLEPERTSP
jgi:hypothetical protein